MLKNKVFYLLIFALLIISCKRKEPSLRLAEDAAVNYNCRQPLDSFAIHIKKYYQLPAVAIGVIEKDGVISTAVVGDNKAKNGVSAAHKSKFQIASCTKSFTALLVAIYVDKNKISWNTKASEVFPEVRILPSNKEITIKDLLSHTSGLQQFWTDEEVFGIDSIVPGLFGNVVQQRNKFTEWILIQPPACKKEEHHYSNAGYVVAAAMLEKITGKSYEILIKENLLIPLQLNSAEFGYAFLKNNNEPHRHMQRNPDGTGITLSQNERIPSELFNPCGFLSLSIEDFAKYLHFNIEMLDNNSEIISNNTFLNLFESYHTMTNGNGVGLGWQIIEIGGIKTFGHVGSDQSMRAGMAINPKQKKGVVFVTNIGDYRSEQALVNVIHELIF